MVNLFFCPLNICLCNHNLIFQFFLSSFAKYKACHCFGHEYLSAVFDDYCETFRRNFPSENLDRNYFDCIGF